MSEIALPTREELEAERKICDAATNGPWNSGHEEFVCDEHFMAVCRINETVSYNGRTLQTRSNGPESRIPNKLFISHARTALPIRNAQCLALLGYFEQLNEQVVGLLRREQRLKEMLKGSEHHVCHSSDGGSLGYTWTDAEIDAAVKGDG